MRAARRLELFVGIPAWLVAVAAYFEVVPAQLGPISIGVFFVVWIFGFLSEEKKFFRG